MDPQQCLLLAILRQLFWCFSFFLCNLIVARCRNFIMFCPDWRLALCFVDPVRYRDRPHGVTGNLCSVSPVLPGHLMHYFY